MTGKHSRHHNVSFGQFMQNLSESGLFDSADLLPDSVAAADGVAAARQLVAGGKLTEFQADAVLERRFGDLVMGNYEILDRLGAGGMGTVFKARHRRMKRVVALKVLSPEVAGSEKFAGRFQREVETIARLSHPNVVMAYDADEGASGPFLVMEFVSGRDLSSEVGSGGPLAPADAVECVLQAARGLEYAHAKGIVHRDIKPGNLLRTADGAVKVADLGLARLNDPGDGSGGAISLTQTGTVVGTAEYMSPEQARDSTTIDHRADIYSLGCTLYFLLTGHPPYQAASIMALLLKQRDAPIPDMLAARPDLPPELDTIFRRMVAKVPADRYQSMTEVVRVLERVQSRLGRTSGPAAARQAYLVAPADPTPRTAEFDLAAGGDDTGFEVSLPATVPPGLTVVLAEPSRTQAGIIRQYLQQIGVGVVHTTGFGREALELAARERAGLVVSAMHLGDMTATQLARTLLGTPGCESVGFILVTSAADTQELGEVPDNSRIVVMPKPFDPQQLAATIAALVG